MGHAPRFRPNRWAMSSWMFSTPLPTKIRHVSIQILCMISIVSIQIRHVSYQKCPKLAPKKIIQVIRPLSYFDHGDLISLGDAQSETLVPWCLAIGRQGEDVDSHGDHMGISTDHGNSGMDREYNSLREMNRLWHHGNPWGTMKVMG
jgi:hypothetical protein